MDDSGSDEDNHSDNGNESNDDVMQGQEGEVLVINPPVEEVEPRAQRVRLNHPNVIPHDAHTSLNPQYTEIAIDSLMQGQKRGRFTYIPLQLIRIVSGTNSENRGTQRTNYYNVKNRNLQNGNVNYSRIFLFREISSTKGQLLVYFLETSKQKNLWNKNTQL